MASFFSRLLSRFSSGQPDQSTSPEIRMGEGDQQITLESVQVQGALPKGAALASLRQGMSHLQQIMAGLRADSAIAPSGKLALAFRTEPDGVIRMVLVNDNTLTGDGADALKQQFIGLAMSSQWRFTSAPGPSLVQAVFRIGE